MQIDMFLGKHVSEFLRCIPFSSWAFNRSVETDLPETVVSYVFYENGLELRCTDKEVIDSIFLFAEEYDGFDDSVGEIAMDFSREQVLHRLGDPSQSGGPANDPVLGKYGVWDRFDLGQHAIHVEYKYSSNVIAKITFMRLDSIVEDK